ncbi:hypothetical protein IJI31_06065 [bacterium]|nr:hypothetical protein [bacterium]
MGKKEIRVFDIVNEGFLMYFRNLKKFLYYMTFPVLGQVLGLLLIFGMTFIYTSKVPYLVSNFKFFDNFAVLIIVAILLVIPGFIIFFKAFWDYLVAYGAVNSMVAAMVKTGKLYDFPAHNQVIIRRSAAFVLLWILFSIYLLLSLNIIFWVVGFIFFVYFSLIFQVFTLEETSPLESFRRSFQLVRGNFAKTLFILIILFIVTYLIIPQIIVGIFDVVNGIDFSSGLIQGWTSQFPVDSVNQILITLNMTILTPLIIAKWLISVLLSQVIIQYLLPLRSIVLCLWYKQLKKIDDKASKKKSKISELQE